MPVMTTGTLRGQLEYIDRAVRTFHFSVSDDWDSVYDKVFKEISTDKAWLQDTMIAGFGPARESGEGKGVQYDSLTEGWSAYFKLAKFDIGFAVTEEAKIFGKLMPVLDKGTKAMAVSIMHTREMVCADVLNEGFTTAYVGGDGKALFATDHPLVREGSGTYANRLLVDADYSESALEQMQIDVRKTKDDAGFYAGCTTDMQVLPPELEFVAERVCKSALRSGTAANDANALKNKGLMQKDPIIWPYLTSDKAWFVTCNRPNFDGLRVYKHSKVDGTPRTWIDENTGTTNVRAVFFLVPGWFDPRCIRGCPGASV